MRIQTTTVLAIGLLTAVAVTAQSDDSAARAKQEAKQEKVQLPLPALTRASETLGAKVMTGIQEKADAIGELEDMIVNASNGQAIFGVVSTGGFLGMGETLTAVPCELLVWRQRPGSDKPILVLETTKQKLTSAPKFEVAKLEHCLTDESWRKETSAAFGTFPKVEKVARVADASGTNLKVGTYKMASTLRGAAVRGGTDKLGSADDLILDRAHHTVTYVIVDDRPIPWNVLSIRDGDLYVMKTKDEFKSAPKLEKDAVARLGNEEFCARVKAFYTADKH